MNAILDVKLLHEVDKYLEGEVQIKAFEEVGNKLFAAFPPKEERISTQVRNLQQIVISARRLSDIEAFVKNQMGKQSGTKEWRQVGDDVLTHLAQLRTKADSISPDEVQRLLLRVTLARGWVKAVVGAYLYAKAHEEMYRARP